MNACVRKSTQALRALSICDTRVPDYKVKEIQAAAPKLLIKHRCVVSNARSMEHGTAKVE